MKVSALQAASDIDATQWDELRAHCPDATVFQGRAWLRGWLDALAPAPERLRLFAAFEGSRLTGLAPLVQDVTEDGTVGSTWRFVADDYSDYQTFLAWDASPRTLDRLLEAIDAALPPGDSVEFNDLPQFSALALKLADRARSVASGIEAGHWIVCPALDVRTNPAGVARVLRKDSLVRHERTLRKLGSVSIEHLETAEAAATLLPTLFDQHIERWSGTEHPSLFLKPHNRRFYEQVTRELAATGELLYSAVKLNDRVVAQHFGLRSRDSLLWYKPAFDVALSRASPGEVLLKTLVEYAIAQGSRELDFTRGGEAFKTRFASGVSYNRHFTWHRRFSSAVKARLLQRAKAAARGVLRRGVESPSTLGGAGISSNTSRRVALIGADAATISAVVSSLRKSDVEVLRLESIEATANGSFVLTLPCSESAFHGLAGLPEVHPLRARALMPGRTSMDAAEQWLKAAPTSDVILCLCVGGKLIRCFAGDIPDAAAIHATAVLLDALRWHGFAAVTLDKMRPVSLRPWLQGSIAAAAAAGVDFTADMLQIAQGRALAPQAVFDS